MTKRRINGYSLLEILMAISVLGVLTTAASSAYTGFAERGRLARATADIAHIAMRIEQYRTRPDNLAAAPPASLADLGLDAQQTTDPWGNPYRYLSLADWPGADAAWKDRDGVALNTDYDLYSAGRDGDTSLSVTGTASLDDVVRALNGDFIGSPADYRAGPHVAAPERNAARRAVASEREKRAEPRPRLAAGGSAPDAGEAWRACLRTERGADGRQRREQCDPESGGAAASRRTSD